MLRPTFLVSVLVSALALSASASTSGSLAAIPAGGSGSGVGNGTVPGGPGGAPPNGPPGGGSSTSAAVLSGVYTVDGIAQASQTSQTKRSANNLNITSTQADVSAFFATNGSTFTVTNSKFHKISGDTASGDNSNFYGQNAAFLVNNGSQVVLNNVQVDSSAEGSNAIFSTGSTTVVKASNIVIKTTKNSSRGLDATMGGAIYAKNVKISTKGAHCGALATDRGEGTVYVQSAVLETAGEGSPCIYSTGNITCISCVGKATGSEAAVIEGKNSITIMNSNIAGAVKHGVMLYQSMSGDASVGVATFTAKRSTVTATVSPMFKITNTHSIINLEDVKLNHDGDLLLASEDWWGTSGSNGGHVTLNAVKQVLKGDVVVDNISTLTMNLTRSSSYTGAINTANNASSVALVLDASSKWTVTGTSNVTTLTSADTKLSNIVDKGHTIYYQSSGNTWLNGKTVSLRGGGKLVPY